MKICELCKGQARTFCESDQACLCWSCDAEVHGANFLVARHSRTLLCHSCQFPTPWKASGAKLGSTFSLCETCNASLIREQSQIGNKEDFGTDDDIDDDDDSVDYDVHHQDLSDSDYDDEVDGYDDDGENQVVPFSTSSTPPPPASSSSSDEIDNRFANDDADFSDSVSVFSSNRRPGNATDLRLQTDNLIYPSGYRQKFVEQGVVESRTDKATCYEQAIELPKKWTGSDQLEISI